jgi:hypothetical protein
VFEKFKKYVEAYKEKLDNTWNLPNIHSKPS